MKTVASAFTLLLAASATPAAAECSYQGGYYGVGSVICSAGGWLEQCTVAGYWSAIGQCKAGEDVSGAAADPDNTDVFAKDPGLSPAIDAEEAEDNADSGN